MSNSSTQLNSMVSIRCGGMGAHDQWDRNKKSADNKGYAKDARCAHCSKGMEESTGWVVRWVWQNDTIISFDSTEGEIIRLGNECVKQWSKSYPELANTHFVKVGA